jgi:hypothetical protein
MARDWRRSLSLPCPVNASATYRPGVPSGLEKTHGPPCLIRISFCFFIFKSILNFNYIPGSKKTNLDDYLLVFLKQINYRMVPNTATPVEAGPCRTEPEYTTLT